MIDHSRLHPTFTDDDIIGGLEISKKRNVAAACVKPCDVARVAEFLEDSGVKTCAVVSFSHGNSTTLIKLAECRQCLDDGATEIDMVVHIGDVLSENWDNVEKEIQKLNACAVSRGAILKVIFENDYLDETQIVRLTQICAGLQVDGSYNYQGTTDAHLRLI